MIAINDSFLTSYWIVKQEEISPVIIAYEMGITMGMERESYLHVLLIAKTREENGWQIKESFTHLLNEYNQEDLEKRKLIQELEPFWKGDRFTREKSHSRVITKIMPNGKAGFIKEDSGQDYYFCIRDIKDRNVKKEAGEKVLFNIKRSYDKSKERESLAAVEIQAKN